MNLYVYRTARGLLRTARGETPSLAWAMALARHLPVVMFNLNGDAWKESRSDCARAVDAWIPADHALKLYLDACAAEMPAAAEELPRLASGAADVAPGLLRMCAERGLVLLFPVVPQSTLTFLGRAFVERRKAVAGGAR